MFGRQLVRYLHTSFPTYTASNKTLLSKLRKKTGYTFANCKKALEENNYDLALAEKWLHKQAQQLGWSKATKLEGRITTQGLVGIAIHKNNATIIEVNCETDFVARNKNFSSLVELATSTCLKHAETLPQNAALSKFQIDSESLKSLVLEDGRTLGDHTALVIGKLGENLFVRRAICFQATNNILLAGYAHPDTQGTPVLLGKYGAIVAFQTDEGLQPDAHLLDHQSIGEIGRQLCQHVVGMNPVKIGTIGQDEPAANPDDETCMIYQEYLLDPTQIVHDILGRTAITILDFARYECGETVAENSKPEQHSDIAVEVTG